MNKRWRELADLAWDQIDSIYSSELADGEIELAKHFILETIWTAVNEERERMVVVLPSESEAEKACSQRDCYTLESQRGFVACYHWLREHAKVGVGE